MFARIKSTFKLVRLLQKQGRLPSVFWAGGAFVVLYLLSPVDLIPDIAPIIGVVDDIALLIWGYKATEKLVEKVSNASDKAKAEAITVEPK